MEGYALSLIFSEADQTASQPAWLPSLAYHRIDRTGPYNFFQGRRQDTR